MTDAERELRRALSDALNLPGPWAAPADVVRAVLPLLLEREREREMGATTGDGGASPTARRGC